MQRRLQIQGANMLLLHLHSCQCANKHGGGGGGSRSALLQSYCKIHVLDQNDLDCSPITLHIDPRMPSITLMISNLL